MNDATDIKAMDKNGWSHVSTDLKDSSYWMTRVTRIVSSGGAPKLLQRMKVDTLQDPASPLVAEVYMVPEAERSVVALVMQGAAFEEDARQARRSPQVILFGDNTTDVTFAAGFEIKSAAEVSWAPFIRVSAKIKEFGGIDRWDSSDPSLLDADLDEIERLVPSQFGFRAIEILMVGTRFDGSKVCVRDHHGRTSSVPDDEWLMKQRHNRYSPPMGISTRPTVGDLYELHLPYTEGLWRSLVVMRRQLRLLHVAYLKLVRDSTPEQLEGVLEGGFGRLLTGPKGQGGEG